VVREGVQSGRRGAPRLGRPSFDPVWPVVVALILVAALALVLLILLLSFGKRDRRLRHGRLMVFRGASGRGRCPGQLREETRIATRKSFWLVGRHL
jgi:hypothetical protein